MPKITINGNEHFFQSEITIAAMLNSLKIPTPGTAVAVNEYIVMQIKYEKHELKDGDQVEIIRAIGGG